MKYNNTHSIKPTNSISILSNNKQNKHPFHSGNQLSHQLLPYTLLIHISNLINNKSNETLMNSCIWWVYLPFYWREVMRETSWCCERDTSGPVVVSISIRRSIFLRRTRQIESCSNRQDVEKVWRFSDSPFLLVPSRCLEA